MLPNIPVLNIAEEFFYITEEIFITLSITFSSFRTKSLLSFFHLFLFHSHYRKHDIFLSEGLSLKSSAQVGLLILM